MNKYEFTIHNGVKSNRQGAILRDLQLFLFPRTINWVYATSFLELDTIEQILSGKECLDNGRIYYDNKTYSLAWAQSWLKKNAWSLCEGDFLIDELSIVDNFIMCSDIKLPIFARDRQNRKLVEGLLKRFHIDIDVSMPVISLSAVQRYQLQVLKCLFQSKRIVILDMSRIGLSGGELSELLRTMILVKEAGMVFVVLGFTAHEFIYEVDNVIIVNNGITIFHETMNYMMRHDRWGEYMRSINTYTNIMTKETQELSDECETAVKLEHIKTDKLSDVCLELKKGEIAVVYAESHDIGVEFFSLLQGDLTPDKGLMLVNGKPAEMKGSVYRRARDGVICISSPNAAGFFFNNLSAWHNYALQKGMDTPDIWYKWHLAENLKNALDKAMGENLSDKSAWELSREEKLRIRFLSQGLARPSVIVSDDPFSYINPNNWEKMQEILDALTKRGIAIIIISRFKNTYNMVKASRYLLKDTGSLVKKHK